MTRSNKVQSPDAIWYAHYNALLNWSANTVHNEHVNCPKNCIFKNLAIGPWLSEQRARMRGVDKSLSQLDDDKRELLQMLVDDGKLWIYNPDRRTWDDMFAVWTRWAHEKNGGKDYNVHHSEVYEGIRLGAWLNVQRVKLRDRYAAENGKGPLTESQRAKLNELAASGKLRLNAPDSFQIKFKLMMKWSEETVQGLHCNVPYDCVYEGERLGVWLNTQRQRMRGGTTKAKSELKVEQRQMLDELVQARKLWLHEPDSWDEKFLLLLEWSEENNQGQHVNVPQAAPPFKGVRLGAWLATQRNRYRGKLGRMRPLTSEQKNKLDQLIAKGMLKMKLDIQRAPRAKAEHRPQKKPSLFKPRQETA